MWCSLVMVNSSYTPTKPLGMFSISLQVKETGCEDYVVVERTARRNIKEMVEQYFKTSKHSVHTPDTGMKSERSGSK